ncbi:hypothetical protein K2173_024287 [Erythroxylum novogranatense]|uniref:3-hydroxyisobutyrate dehydrogenase-like NAD-binding domain-containing protein n=1 Tax=Erythroxylum novogranatense TaxID=1862640 RepID=A0AAV8SU46_9ROSI|nr:hypothetical protein K2173_024287 [Erythroxylum novogranatense]
MGKDLIWMCDSIQSRFYLGDVGNGAAMKLLVNMVMGSMMATFSEGLLLSERVGLDPNVLVAVVSQGAISAPMYSLKGPTMIKSQYPTAFPLKHQQKVCNNPIFQVLLPTHSNSSRRK